MSQLMKIEKMDRQGAQVTVFVDNRCPQASLIACLSIAGKVLKLEPQACPRPYDAYLATYESESQAEKACKILDGSIVGDADFHIKKDRTSEPDRREIRISDMELEDSPCGDAETILHIMTSGPCLKMTIRALMLNAGEVISVVEKPCAPPSKWFEVRFKDRAAAEKLC